MGRHKYSTRLGVTFEGLQLEASEDLGWNLVHIHNYYKRVVHTSTSKSPLETSLGYFPPSFLDIAYQQRRMGEDLTGDALRVGKIVENIR